MKYKLLIILVSSFYLIGCSNVPKSRSHFIDLMKEGGGLGAMKRMSFKKTIPQPFNKVVINIDDKLQGCVPGGYQTITMRRNGLSSSETIKNNNRIEKDGKNKAKVTIQQHHSNTLLQSDGGFYLLAADLTRIDEKTTQIHFYTGKHYLSIATAIENWANGSNKCHGIGGNP